MLSRCFHVLESKLIRDDQIKVFKYSLERVREIYNDENGEPKRIISTHITFDVLTASFGLLTIYPDQSVNSDAMADAEYIVKNIKVIK